MKCPYCSAAQSRSATTISGRLISECSSCGRVVEERQTQSHHLFHLRVQDYPLNLVTSDLPTVTTTHQNDVVEEDPFEQTGFITSFSTWSLEPYPVFTQSSMSFSGHLAELERVLEATSSSNSSLSSGPSVVVDNLRAYLQIIDVASILRLDSDISEHAFQLFRDCSSATCLRNRSVEALATAALVQAIREAQEPRTLQEISIAANLPQKEIGKYIKILGEALQLSQPINSNSISVHMPRFCTLLQLNKSAQELATHIGEVVINKCFCTRRNPISISAAAIYLACQLEDKRKTQAEICKVTGLTEVTLRKVYKELLENWDDLLPSNYTPAVPPEKAFPTATISSGRTTPRSDIVEGSSFDKDKQPIVKPIDISEAFLHITGKEDIESKDNAYGTYNPALQQTPAFWKLQVPSGTSQKPSEEKNENMTHEMDFDKPSKFEDLEKKVDKESKFSSVSSWQSQFSSKAAVNASSMSIPVRPSVPTGNSASRRFLQIPKFNPGSKRLFVVKGHIQNIVSALFNIILHLHGPNMFFANTIPYSADATPDSGSVILMIIEVLTRVFGKHTLSQVDGCYVSQSLRISGGLFQNILQLKISKANTRSNRLLIPDSIGSEILESMTTCAVDRQFMIELYAACCRLLCTVLKHYRSESQRCSALLEDAVHVLLCCLEIVEVDTVTTRDYLAWEVQEGIKCACFLRRIYEEVRQQKDVLGCCCFQLLSRYIIVYSGYGPCKMGIRRDIDEALRPGIYALIDACSADDLQRMHTVFGEGPCRSTLATLQHDSNSIFSMKGKFDEIHDLVSWHVNYQDRFIMKGSWRKRKIPAKETIA